MSPHFVRAMAKTGALFAVLTLAIDLPKPIGAQPATPARVDRPGLVYDSHRQVFVLFGGGFGDRMTGETWEHDGRGWRRGPAVGPPKRNTMGMVFDSGRNRVVLFGGYVENSLGDTWEYDGRAWREVATGGPSPRGALAMAYDSRRGRTVLFGGGGPGSASLTDTWEWDGRVWTEVTTTRHPTGSSFHRMAFDEARGQVVSFGGRWGASETWGFDGRDWTMLSDVGPPARDHHAMTYDSHRRTVLLFGGSRQLRDRTYPRNAPMLRDMWEWNGVQWTQLSDDGPEHYGGLPGFAYDRAHHELVLFGRSSDPALDVSAVPGFWRSTGTSWRAVD
jgi:hypothetical protein